MKGGSLSCSSCLLYRPSPPYLSVLTDRMCLRFLAEVQIRVQVFDNGDLSPLANAQVVVHGNQTVLASSRAGTDGVLRVTFPYRLATWIIISASKQDYVTNSVPWHSGRVPRKSGHLTYAHDTYTPWERGVCDGF